MTIYLYVAEHNSTGLKYFGKTINPKKSYKGSGSRWFRHLKKHGWDVTMNYIAEFDDIGEASSFALKFSEEHNIVNSCAWANCRPENCFDGGVIGVSHSEERKRRISEGCKKSWNEERRINQSLKLKGLKRTEETKDKMKGPLSDQHKQKLSDVRKGISIPHRKICRLFDRKEMSVCHYTRWLKATVPSQLS